jgi:hypothetical protein
MTGMLGRLFEGFEERLVGFLFWAAIFVPLLIGAVVVAHRYRVVDDMLGGTGAPEAGSDGDWMTIGKSLTSFTPAPPPPPMTTAVDAPKHANGEIAGGGGPPAETTPTVPNPSEPGKMASKGGVARPLSANDGGGTGTGTGAGTGPGDGTGTGAVVRSEGAGGTVGAKKPCLPPVDEIKQENPNTWSIDRSLLEHYAKHLQEFDDLAVTLPSFDDKGKPDGFHVTGMRCGNPLHQGGLRNGDVVHTINGKHVNTVVQAAVAYAKLRDETHLELAVTRKGADIVLEYDVVE